MIDPAVLRLIDLCRSELPDRLLPVDPTAPVFVFYPPLSPAEQDILADLTVMARFGVTLTLAEWQAIQADAEGLKAYLGVASPTAAQTAAATKAIIRVLGTIIRS